MTQEQKTQMFNQYKHMVGSLAHGFDPEFGQIYQDVYERGEAWLEETVARWDQEGNRFDATKSSESTYIFRGIRYRMLDAMRDMDHSANPVVRGLGTQGTATVSILEKEDGSRQGNTGRFIAPPSRPYILRLLADISEEAAVVVQLVILAPAEIADEISIATRGRGREAVRRYLAQNLGWPQGKIDLVFAEVREAL